MPARVTTYLLLELDAQSDTFYDGVCESIVRQVTSRGQGGGDDEYKTTFRVGKLCCGKLTRLHVFYWLCCVTLRSVVHALPSTRWKI